MVFAYRVREAWRWNWIRGIRTTRGNHNPADTDANAIEGYENRQDTASPIQGMALRDC